MLTDYLKSVTQENHQRLEGILIPRIKQVHTTEGYRKIIGQFLEFLEPLEKQLHSYITPELLPDYPVRRKTSLLRADLQAGESLVIPSPAKPPLVIIKSKAEAIGALYIVEGSTLGGPHISRMFQKNLADLRVSYSFFDGYGDKTMEMWNSFKEAINKVVLTEDEIAEATEKANEVFYAMHQWFAKDGSS